MRALCILIAALIVVGLSCTSTSNSPDNGDRKVIDNLVTCSRRVCN